jgi:hypothetical protein
VNVCRPLIAIIVGALFWQIASAIPIVDTDMARGEFGTMRDAVRAAGEQYLEHSRHTDREYVGGVLRDRHGRYRYTVGHAAAGTDTVRFRVGVVTGHELVGFWHTHGRQGSARELFSAEDVALVKGQGLPLYLITPNGHIRKLEPGRLRRVHGRRSALAVGRAAAGVIVDRL